MKIYRIHFDVDNYQHFDQPLGDTSTSQGMNTMLEKTRRLYDCKTVTEPLTPPEVFIPRPKFKRPDFLKFSLYHTFAVSPTSLKKVQNLLEASGELLPLPYKSELFSVLNVLKCVDYEVYPEDVPGRLHQEHMGNRIPSTIFRGADRVYLYVAEKTGDSATEFKAFVEQEKMTGLKFYEVWNSG